MAQLQYLPGSSQRASAGWVANARVVSPIGATLEQILCGFDINGNYDGYAIHYLLTAMPSQVVFRSISNVHRYTDPAGAPREG